MTASRYQSALFETAEPDAVVNVATVPQRSPFRYPGGKTWLVPKIRQWLASRPQPVAELVEPFAGGGIVALTVAFESLAERVTLVELDPDIAAVWQTILSHHHKWLSNEILSFQMSHENVRHAMSNGYLRSRRGRAFLTILRNRISRGGIMAPGAGIVKSGENGKGLSSRWYPETLSKRITEIGAIHRKIRFVLGNGLDVLQQRAGHADAAFFIDPPYTVAGRRLYLHNELDHGQLFALAANLAGDFLMTYDNTEDIRALAHRHGFDTRCVAMKSTHHEIKKELLIGRDLGWLTDCVPC